MPRLIPREWTIVGVLTTDLAAALALGLPSDWWRALLAVLAFFVHLTTFSALFEQASRRAVSAPLLLANALPYIPALSNMPTPLFAFLLALAAAVLLAAAGGRVRTPVGYVAGLALYSSLVMPMRALLGPPAPGEYAVYVAYVAYFTAFALYVESRLAFRSLDPTAPLLLWLPSAAYVATLNPLAVVALAEPTYLLADNYLRHRKVSTVNEIRRMGKRILASSFLFTALLITAYKAGTTLI